ncbi:MAG: DUF4428 domain-containing protein [Acutalibacteraceae bacterium]|nr:DUF4428 domain-containing protein [Acutalibacteraceae bacterium]
MGLFDRKFCDICGQKIGLLGNRKLEDGNLCKDCAGKLSPFFDERRHSTIAQIQQQLAYREQNKYAVAQFNPTKSYGNGKKVYVDMNANKFIVTRASNWRNDNPDVIDISQVIGVNTDIKEHKKEIYYKDAQGEQKSYNPRRYEYSYEFKVKINVNSPWFDDINLELSEFKRPDSTHSPKYNEYMMEMNELKSVLSGRGLPMNNFGQTQNYGQQGRAQANNMGGILGGVMGAIGLGLNMATQQNQGYNNNGMNQPMNMNNGMNMNTGMNMNNGMGQPMMNNGMGQSMNMGMNQPMMNMNNGMPQGNIWTCSCGMQNTAGFCQNCGQPKPMQSGGIQIRCDKCGWMLAPGQPIPSFCPNCGDPINQNDLT